MAATGRHGDADLIPRSAPGLRTAVTPVPGARDPKLAERVAPSIEADVLRAGWPVGLVIGSEDQLAARYGVGRAVIREAIRLAEHRQVARMRRGRGGGLVVVEPDASAVTESLAIYLEYARAGVGDLLEARSVLEAFAAAAAAGAADEERLLALRDAARAEGRPAQPRTAYLQAAAGPGGAAESPAVHELIAQVTGNAALSLFIHAIVSLSGPLTARPAGHRAIVEAVAAGDAGLARVAMSEHMAGLAAAQPDGSANLGPGGSAGPRPGAQGDGSGPGAGEAGRPYRPANAVAARIRREIVRQGWPVGQSLGFESDLLRKYGVGRAQFREAIRILEHHSVVRMQRGAAGGMVVAAPDGQAVVRTASLYLTYQGMNSGHLRDLREELEAATLRMAIGRLDAAGEERLTAMLELERTWPDEDFPAVSHDLHAVIAELAGNQTLALLLSILMQLSAERLYSGNRVRAGESADATRHAHRAIVAAMIARDTGLAQRRMRTHLAALARSTAGQPALRRR